jgi:hypothetical protein
MQRISSWRLELEEAVQVLEARSIGLSWGLDDEEAPIGLELGRMKHHTERPSARAAQNLPAE